MATTSTPPPRRRRQRRLKDSQHCARSSDGPSSPDNARTQRCPPSTHRDRLARCSYPHRLSSDGSLPFDQGPLSKSDLGPLQCLFAYYLDVQKSLKWDELSKSEVKGRWKSFIGKWNRGELAEGWYDPETRFKANERYDSLGRKEMAMATRLEEHEAERDRELGHDHDMDNDDDDDGDDDDDNGDGGGSGGGFGPALPIKGAGIPSLSDLEHRQILAEESRSARLADLRHERKQDRASQKERLDELVPRADLASRERQMEKKRVSAATKREFQAAKEAGDVEVGESELMGGQDDNVGGYRAKRKARERVRSERQARREEIVRARMAEREERRRGVRAKEEKTMEMLRELAKQRFG